MADTNPFQSLINAARGFGQLPMMRQFGMLLGLAASVALGVAVVMWSKEPTYRPLFSHLNPQESTDVLDALQSSGIKYKLDQSNGTIMVPADAVYHARLKLASDGLPAAGSSSFENMLKEQSIGTSRFMENAKYLYALEGELDRTISSLSSVKLARVHLAIPKESAFVGDEKKPTASVLIDLASGKHLSANQVQAVVHMVASSVTNLEPSQVTVVDENGNLLTAASDEGGLGKSTEEFKYTKNLEKSYEKRIESILTPLVGIGNVRATVSALLDFTKIEQTREQYIPNKALRSEKVIEQGKVKQEGAAKGVPGMAANQPAAKDAKNKAIPQANNAEGNKGPYKMQAVRNYEVGRMISHSQVPTGNVKRVSVAVVVNDKRTVDQKTGKVTETPLTQDEINKLTTLVKNTIGFEQQRGDQISVVNIPFVKTEKIEAPKVPPMWEQNWFWDIIKIALGSVLVLLLVFLVLRPTLKSLAAKGVDAPPLSYNPQMLAGAPGAMPQGMAGMPGQAAAPQVPPPQGWNAVQQAAMDDPMRIAQVMNNWVGSD